MFGMGGTEIIVILIVALLFLGPDKLPEAAKSISKGIRDLKKQSRVLQRTIEDDEHIGGAIRDLKSALRGEDEPIRPAPLKPPKQLVEPVTAVAALAAPGTPEHGAGPDEPAADRHDHAHPVDAGAGSVVPSILGPRGDAGDATAADPAAHARPALTMPATAGEPDGAASTAGDDADLAAMVKPAPDTIPHKPRSAADPAADLSPEPSAAPSPEPSVTSEPKHG